jgi:dTDP-4-amino-4,6-dideoxygalactose transaminase
MQVPFVDLKSQYKSIKTEIDSAVAGVFERTEFVHGPSVRAFEAAFAKAHDAKFCAACNSGTAALHLILAAMGVGPGDEVITAVNTFIATAEAIACCGAKPVFVDIDEQSYNLDPKQLKAAITASTKAIIPVHLYGQPAQMDAIVEIANQHNIPVVEDAAQAHLAKYKDKTIGSFGIASGFSFYPAKNLGAAGEGGGILTNDAKLYEQICCLRDHGSENKYTHLEMGFNYRMSGIQGAILGIKLPHLSKWNSMRRAAAARYSEGLKGIDGIKIPQEIDSVLSVYHLYVIRVTPEFGMTREELQTRLADRGVGAGIHYPVPLHLQPAAKYLGYKKGDFPVAELCSSQILSLPIFSEISTEQINHVLNMIREIAAEGSSIAHK